ncbi:hypothetical protein L7F22_058244 [Adiantum nelumboides]|nr:hypothetical protein [Adiantum nelumboides]
MVEYKKLFISSWLTQEYERDIRAAWNHLRMTKRDTVDAYCERFWSAFLPTSSFKKISFREQIERFTFGLPTEIRDHCLKQKSASIQELMSHAKGGFAIHSGSLTYPTDELMTQRDKQTFGNESRKRKRNPEKKDARPKLTPQERACFIREGKCFGCGEPGHISAKCPKKAQKEQNDKDDDRPESSRAAEERGRKGKMKTGMVPDCVGTDPNTMDESTELCQAWGKVKDQEALIFFDGGAKANFISPELAARLEITPDLMGPPAEAVLAEPGRDTAITPVIGKLWLHCQGYLGHEDFYIIPLEGCDVLVGIPLPQEQRCGRLFARKATLTTEKGRTISVLVTMDRHEWYAQPQLYKRDDVNGLWQIQPAVPTGNILPTPFGSADIISQPVCLAEGEDKAFITDSPVSVDSKDREFGSLDAGSTFAAGSDQPGVHTLERGECKRRRVLENNAEQGNKPPVCNGELLEPTNTDKLPENHEVGVNDVSLSTGSGSSFAENVLEATFAMFEVHIPPSAMLDGVQSQHFFGTGVVIHHSESLGLVAVDRNTVAIAVSDVMLSFAAYPVEISAEVVFLHPVHNYAIVAYNPESLGDAGAAAIRAAVLLPEPPIHRGESVHLIGLSRSLQVTSRKSVVTDPGAALKAGYSDYSRFRAMNMKVIELDTGEYFGHSFSGVLSDEFGRVKALWASFSTQVIFEIKSCPCTPGVYQFSKKVLCMCQVKYGDTPAEDMQFARGIPIQAICEVLDKILKGNSGPSLVINGIKRHMPTVRILEAELYPTLLSKARSFGLSDSWVLALAKKDPVRRQVLRVKGCLAGSKAEKALEQGDMLLAVDGRPITCFQDVDHACNMVNEQDNNCGLKLTVFRQGMELMVVVGLDVRDGFGTTRMVNWAGAIIQDSHPSHVYRRIHPQAAMLVLARWSHGSPAHRYGLYALQWIVEINGKCTPDLDTFIQV